jgi:hypothetical protein
MVNITKASAIAFLKSIVCRFGVPNRIITNNGTQFKSQHFQEYCEDIGIQLRFASMAHPRSNSQVEQANAEILRGSRFAPTTILKSMVRSGLTSFRAYYGGTGPHPAERPGRLLSSWSMGPKHAFPRRSPWAHYESKLSMTNCRSGSIVKMWTSSMSEDGEQRSEMHGITKRSSITINGSCIVGSSRLGT